LRLTGFVFTVLLFALSYGQHSSYVHLKNRTFIVKKPEIQIDTFSIQPYYFEVYDSNRQLIPKSNYQIDFVNATLHLFNFETYKNKQISVKYLVYPAYLQQVYRRFSPEMLKEKDTLPTIGYDYVSQRETKLLEGLTTKGSITRGFNTGNRQSLVMQSGLDLKIEGKISEKLRIKAVLSDDNLPQAYAGISQSYKEFDRIYMQLTAPKWQATGGDLILDNNEHYFLKFLRKTQGISLKTKHNNTQLQITGGYVEGQFAINRFNGIDGNQGPYTLKGKQGETYIFIIPKSEKVYINGKILKRGINNDYTIDYETAEIRFNPTVPISHNHRIVIEFNYANQHYVRYLNYNKYQHKGDKSNWSVYSFIESDIKSQTLLYDLTKEQVKKLQQAGDNLQDIWIESAIKTDYNENKILYKKISTSTGYYYQFTTENISGLYEVKFTYLGNNKGNYRIQKIVANGKIFEYTGENQGDYAPVIKLTPPQRKAYLGFNYTYQPNDKTDFFITGLFNHTDNNLFSTNQNFQPGAAIHTKFKQQLWQQKNNNISVFAGYDYVDKHFVATGNYRPVEFNRQWQIDSIYGKQHLLITGIEWMNKRWQTKAGWQYFQLRDTLSAQQAFLQADYTNKSWHINSDNRFTTQTDSGKLQAENSEQKITYDLKKYQFTGKIHFENRDKQVSDIKDSLNYRYTAGEIQFAKKDTVHFGFQVFYRKEQNDSVFNNRWQQSQSSDNFGIRFIRKNKMSQIRLFALYRLINEKNKTNTGKQLNMKFSWQQFLFDKFISGKFYLETYQGATRRDEVVFVKTPPGQGTYQWNDYNHNGITEINEFEIAVYSDQANYIRVILPSKNYIPTLNNSYSGQISLNPEVWKKQSFIKHLFATFSYENRFEIIKTTTGFPLVLDDKQSISQYSLWQQDWFLNRSKKKYFLHFNYQFIKQKQLLLIGNQSQQLEKYQLDSKHGFTNYLIWKQKFMWSSNTNRSENYQQKNFLLETREWEEGLQWRQQKKRSFYIYFKYKKKDNLTGNELLQMYQSGLQYNYTNKNNNLIHLNLQFIQNKMSGNTYSPVAFQMLEGLQNGKNIVFNTLYRKKLTSYLELYLNYGFRLSELHSPVHTGGIQLKMIF
jgi:hypothetical protein